MAERRRRPAADREPPGREAAFEIAGRYLATRPRSRWEVERRLRHAGASDEVVAATLARLEQLAFVDDVAFARWWAEQRDRHAPRGRRLLEAELRQHGVPREVILSLRDETEPLESSDETLPATEGERAMTALQAHLRGRPLPSGDPRAMQRLGTFLVRRGFDPETARAALRAAASAEPAEGEPGIS
jgi:regulatory protein